MQTRSSLIAAYQADLADMPSPPIAFMTLEDAEAHHDRLERFLHDFVVASEAEDADVDADQFDQLLTALDAYAARRDALTSAELEPA